MEIKKVKLTTGHKSLKDVNPIDADPVITKPSVSDNVKRTKEEAESESEFNINNNFKRNFEVDTAVTAVIGTTKLS